MNKVYVFCPAKIVSGGPEALHQLVDAINLLGGDAYIVYTQKNLVSDRSRRTPVRYRRYNTPVASQSAIEDIAQNFFVVPESMPNVLESIKHGVKCLWWLSVGFKQENFDYKTLSNIIHLYQSEHARKFVTEHIGPQRIYPLSDYVLVEPCKSVHKENHIALIERKLDSTFKPLVHHIKKKYQVTVVKGLSRIRLANLLSKTKVFIDFGTHPGKDRLPREAALYGNVILTSTFGASSNEIDVPIRAKYKISPNATNEEISALLDECLQNQEQHVSDFDSYRTSIKNEKAVFLSEVNSVFDMKKSEDSIQNIALSHTPAGSSFTERIWESAWLVYFRRIIEYIRIKVFNN